MYDLEDERAVIEEAELRLPPIEMPPVPEGEEPPPKPLHPAIDIIPLYESRSCEELGAAMREAGYDPKTVSSGTETLFTFKETGKDMAPVNEAKSMKDLFEAINPTAVKG